MKRILALDGGGIRGVFTLEVLLKVEELLRNYYREQNATKAERFVLRDHFDFLAGTSTGAIIATCLCWGMPVKTVMAHYLDQSRKMFERVSLRKPTNILSSLCDPGPISDFLRHLFKEEDGSDGTLASPRLREGERNNLLMVVVRNLSTGSAWPLTNNPDAVYNKREREDCNLDIPLWKLVRASAAAPPYFPPMTATLGRTEYEFVDGSITPYSNPAAIAALTAILPGYHMNWPIGPDKIRLISVGTLTFSSEHPVRKAKMYQLLPKLPTALLQSMSWQQDYLCRCLGKCVFGELLDQEVGYLADALDEIDKDKSGEPKYRVWRPRPESWFSYVRYNRTYKGDEMRELLSNHPRIKRLDAVDEIPNLRHIGRGYAEENVKLEHLL